MTKVHQQCAMSRSPGVAFVNPTMTAAVLMRCTEATTPNPRGAVARLGPGWKLGNRRAYVLRIRPKLAALADAASSEGLPLHRVAGTNPNLQLSFALVVPAALA